MKTQADPRANQRRDRRDYFWTLAEIYRAKGMTLKRAAYRAALAAYLLEPAAPAAPLRSDVVAVCCPAACAAKKTPRYWTKANEVLRSCERGLGAPRSNHTVEEMCQCR